MRPRAIAVVGVLSLALGASGAAAGVAIEHRPVTCVTAGAFPQIEARLEPADEVGRARVHFRAEEADHWHFVEMSRDGDLFRGTLPQPKPGAGSLSYYVEAVDRAFSEKRSPQHTVEVAPRPGDCPKDAVVAGSVAAASVRVGASAGVKGVPRVPVGFAPDGIEGAEVPKASKDGELRSKVLVAGATAVVVAGVAVALAEEGGDPARPGRGPEGGLAGRWVGTGRDGFFFHETNGNAETPVACEEDSEADAFLELSGSGNALTGSLRLVIRRSRPVPFQDPCHEVGEQIEYLVNGNTNGSQIAFELKRENLLNPANMVGSVDGGRMQGNFRANNRFLVQSGVWSLAKQ